MDRQDCGCPRGFHKMSCFKYDEEYEQSAADAADAFVSNLRYNQDDDYDTYDLSDDLSAIVDAHLGIDHATGTEVSYKPTGKALCHHVQDGYTMSNGATVFLTGLLDDYKGMGRILHPDYAVYFDGMWEPDCVAYHIGWPDMRTPVVPLPDVIRIARTVLSFATEGQTVELGCLGAHGRTGTFLAIMELLADHTLNDLQAIDRVRSLHCRYAIETAAQEFYVRQAYAHLHGLPAPRPPTPKRLPRPQPGQTTATTSYRLENGGTLISSAVYEIGEYYHGQKITGVFRTTSQTPTAATAKRKRNRQNQRARRQTRTS